MWDLNLRGLSTTGLARLTLSSWSEHYHYILNCNEIFIWFVMVNYLDANN
jgi:hypothetical protein